MTTASECLHFDYCPIKREVNACFVSTITRNTYTVVLAGMRGSRLEQLTDWQAKPAVPFGGKFRIIDFPLFNRVNPGIRRIGVVTQYKAHSLIRHVLHGWSFLTANLNEFIDVIPAQKRLDENWYLGTADAVFQDLDILRPNHPDDVLILGGDHVYKIDYGRLLALEAFARFYGADFYGLPSNRKTITLVRKVWVVPESIAMGDDVLVPLRAVE